MGANCSELQAELNSLRPAGRLEQKRVSRPLNRVAQQQLKMRETYATESANLAKNESNYVGTNDHNSFEKQAARLREEELKKDGKRSGGKRNHKRTQRKRSHRKRSYRK
jgi:hypothetical protein